MVLIHAVCLEFAILYFRVFKIAATIQIISTDVDWHFNKYSIVRNGFISKEMVPWEKLSEFCGIS